MMYNNETNVSIKGQEWKCTGEVGIKYSCLFVCKHCKDEYICVGIIIGLNYVGSRLYEWDAVVGSVIKLFNDYNGYVVIWKFLFEICIRMAGPCTTDTLARMLHMTLCSCRAWIEVFGAPLCCEVCTPFEVSALNCFE